MSKPTIYILHRPTNTLMCEDGQFRGFYSCCGSKEDTLVYKSLKAALNRVNTNKPGKRLRDDFVKDVVLKFVEVEQTYYKDRFLNHVA